MDADAVVAVADLVVAIIRTTKVTGLMTTMEDLVVEMEAAVVMAGVFKAVVDADQDVAIMIIVTVPTDNITNKNNTAKDNRTFTKAGRSLRVTITGLKRQMVGVLDALVQVGQLLHEDIGVDASRKDLRLVHHPTT